MSNSNRPSQHNQPSVPYSIQSALVPAASYQLESSPTIINTYRPMKDITTYLSEELATDTLDRMRRYLWIAGLPAHRIRPLHRHRVIGREIIVCEQVGLHLVWCQNQIFVKPIPRFLLHHEFYREEVAPNQHLQNQALGFLSTYLKLIQYESDFRIASDLELLPRETTWDDWLKFAYELSGSLIVPIHECPGQSRMLFRNRYDFGELRLDRLNFIMRIMFGRITRGYQSLYFAYSTYFRPFFAMIVGIFAFVSLALSAFQVIQGKSDAPAAVTLVGYGFSIATLIILATTLVLPAVWFFILFLDNAAYALRKRQE